jgi:hypothetical protein
MAKNRRRESAAVRFGPALKVCLLCAFIGGSGMGYVWQKNQIYQLGKQITECEVRLGKLKRDNKLKTDQLAHMQSHPVIEQRVKALNLGLVQTRQEQIIQLREPLPAVPLPKTGTNDPARIARAEAGRAPRF